MTTLCTFPIDSVHGSRRACARRLRSLAAGLLLASIAVNVAASPDDQSRIDVTERDGKYEVVATFRIAQPASIAMAVLTDYERIPTFMPAVRTSRVLERRDTRVVVEQEAVAKVLLFSKRVHLVLEIEESPTVLRFQDRCRKAFSLYEGSWTLEQRTGWTDVTYRLTSKPTFDVPGFLLKRLMRGDSTEMIQRLQAEIAARAKK